MDDQLYGSRGLVIGATVILLFCADVLLKARGLKGRYEILHAIGNGVATALTAGGMLETLFDPIHAFHCPTNMNGYCVCIGIHTYHVLAFRPLPLLEWIHHILMIGLVGPIVFYFPVGSILDYCVFFLSGFPGGMSYVLLALRKNHYVEAITEKRFNAAINTWIRTPFTVIGGYLIFQVVWVKRANLTYVEILAGLFVAALSAWNGIFFGRRVVENYGNRRPSGSDPHTS
jgi:hypothetical protein